MKSKKSKDVLNTKFWQDRIRSHKEITHTVGHFDFDKCNAIHEKIIEEVIPNRSSVLDLGCGYGRASDFFVNYAGVDFVPEFIYEANRMFPLEKFYIADLRNLPFPTQSFDWGVMISIKGMIQGNTDQWPEILEESKRVCKKILVLEYNDPGYEIL